MPQYGPCYRQLKSEKVSFIIVDLNKEVGLIPEQKMMSCVPSVILGMTDFKAIFVLKQTIQDDMV